MRDGPKNYWLAADVVQLINLRDVGKLSFPAIAELFPGRSKKDCANKYYLEQARHANTARVPVERRRTKEEIVAGRQQPAGLPEYTTLTAAFFGDPTPGRSALDKIRAAQPPGAAKIDYRSPDSHPKPTLPGAPL